MSVRLGIAFWSISAGLNIVFTFLISTRLLLIRRRANAVLGPSHGSHYTSVLAIVIESAALYSLWALIFLITYARNNPIQNILLPPLGQIEVCRIPLKSVLLTSRLAGNSAASHHPEGY